MIGFRLSQVTVNQQNTAAEFLCNTDPQVDTGECFSFPWVGAGDHQGIAVDLSQFVQQLRTQDIDLVGHPILFDMGEYFWTTPIPECFVLFYNDSCKNCGAINWIKILNREHFYNYFNKVGRICEYCEEVLLNEEI